MKIFRSLYCLVGVRMGGVVQLQEKYYTRAPWNFEVPIDSFLPVLAEDPIMTNSYFVLCPNGSIALVGKYHCQGDGELP